MTDPFPAAGDRIHVEQLEVQGRIGVTEEERREPQRLVLNITAWPVESFDNLQDEIRCAADYAEICRAVREIVAPRSDKLIETLGTQLASDLLEHFSLKAVEIEVRKFVLPDTKYVSVKVFRKTSTR